MGSPVNVPIAPAEQGPGILDDPDNMPSPLDVALNDGLGDPVPPDMLQDPAQAQPQAQPTNGQPAAPVNPQDPDWPQGVDPETGEPYAQPQGQPQAQPPAQPQGQPGAPPPEGDEGEEFVLQGFDLGDGRYEDLSFERIQQAVAMQGRYETEILTRESLDNIANELAEEFGAATPHYAQVTQIAGQLQQYLDQVQPQLQPPDPASIDPNNPESVQRFQAEMQQYNAHQAQLAQGRQMAEDAQKLADKQEEGRKARQDKAMADLLGRLWPDALSKDANVRAGVRRLLDEYGFPVQEFLDTGDTRLVRIFADLHRARGTMARASQARQQRTAPQVVRRTRGSRTPPQARQPQGRPQARQAATPGQVRHAMLHEGGPEALAMAGDSILAASEV